MNKNLKRMHQIEIEILKEIHKICIKYNLSYYLLGGSMLGAVRHKGIIPWDDDIDIGLPRKDFELLLRYAGSELPSHIKLCTYKNTENHIQNFAKAQNLNTILVESSVRHLGNRGIFVDVFPLDGAPNNKFKRNLHLSSINIMRYLIAIMYIDPKKKRNFMKRMVIKFIQTHINKIKIHGFLDKLLKKYNYDHSNIISNYLGMWREKEMMGKWIMGTPTLIEFEDSMYYGSEYPHEYLTNLYGKDYLKIPSEDERISHHQFKVKYLD